MEKTKKVDRRGRGIVITAARRVIGPEIAMLRVVERKARDLNKKGRARAKERVKERRLRRKRIRQRRLRKTVAKAVIVKRRRNRRIKMRRHG